MNAYILQVHVDPTASLLLAQVSKLRQAHDAQQTRRARQALDRAAHFEQQVVKRDVVRSPSRLLHERQSVHGIKAQHACKSEQEGPGVKLQHLDRDVLLPAHPGEWQRELVRSEEGAVA